MPLLPLCASYGMLWRDLCHYAVTSAVLPGICNSFLPLKFHLTQQSPLTIICAPYQHSRLQFWYPHIYIKRHKTETSK